MSKVRTNEQAMEMIHLPHQQISLFCQRWNVVELSLFGSVLRDDFGQASDIDVLVDFKSGVVYGLFDLVNMETELGDLLGRKVDLVEKKAIEHCGNYLRKKNILKTARVIYAAR